MRPAEPAGQPTASPLGNTSTTRFGQAVTLALLLAVTALAVLHAMHPIYNGDIGWHLALGRTIDHSGAIPLTEPYTWTARGAPMVAHEWLSQRIYWEITEQTGIDGLRWLNALLAGALMPLSFALFRRASGSPGLALLGCVLFALLAKGRFQVRPHMLNLVLGVALYAWLFECKPRLGALRIAACGGCVALWANLHSGATIFPALIGLHGVVAWLEARSGRRAPAASDLGGGAPLRVVALAAVCSAALLATPNHARLVPYLLESGRINQSQSWEWLSILRYVTHPTGDGLVIGAWAALALWTAWLAIRAWRRHEPLAPAAVALFCALLPLQSIRFLWLGFVPLAFIAADAARRLAARPPGSGSRVEIGAVAASVVLAFASLWPAEGPARALHQARAGSAFDPRRFPLGAAHVLSEIELPGRLFAQAEWGGFLTFVLDERYPTFADGRWVTIGERVIDDGHAIASRRPRALELLDRWQVDVLLVERGWMHEDDPALAEWLPVFEGFASALYVRRSERGRAQREVFARYYASVGVPFDEERGFDAHTTAVANPRWSREHWVRRRYLARFREDGSRLSAGRMVEGWPRRDDESPEAPRADTIHAPG